jgi:hypothetical protein
VLLRLKLLEHLRLLDHLHRLNHLLLRLLQELLVHIVNMIRKLMTTYGQNIKLLHTQTVLDLMDGKIKLLLQSQE